MVERLVEIDIAVHAIIDADRAERGELIVEVDAELAEVLVVRVAQRQHGIREIEIAWKVLDAELLIEGLRSIGRIAFAVGAGDEDGIAFLGERGRRIALKRAEERRRGPST